MTREEILHEIRQTAIENGGRPLGMRRFQQVTGITQYEWGRHWARFADAQREAGFEPNTTVHALDAMFVMEKYVALVRRIGRIPTYRELRVQRTRDPDFPVATVFYRRAGKNAFIGRVLEYARSTPGHDDVLAVCEAEYRPRDSERPSPKGARQGLVGFVYLAKGQRSQYKIGRTNLVDRRIAEVGATGPVELELVHEIKTDDPAGVEAYWHKRFYDRRMRGEWFNLSAADVRDFKRWRRIF